MGYDRGKRILLAVLTACLLSLIYLCADGRTIIRWTAEVSNPRQNESLYIELCPDDILYVGGEGKLYGTDLHAMIEGESLTVNDIKNIIVGDDITEIGFDAIGRYEELETIWLGKNVTVAGNGSIRECRSLSFIYLPSGFKRAGKDFLYDCNKCYVVAAGRKKSLPKMKNVGDEMLLTGIKSREALIAALGEDAELPDALAHWWP